MSHIKQTISIALSAVLLLGTSCASIVSKSNYPITINSSPSSAKVTITDKRGVDIYKGNTPTTTRLNASGGFFSKASYRVKIEMSGYDDRIFPVLFKLDGWYFGNLLFGGLIGFLIVDPATGAMFKLDTEYINATLTKSTAEESTKSLKVIEIDQVPESWKEHLVLIEK
jgi:hypothetical protein